MMINYSVFVEDATYLFLNLLKYKNYTPVMLY